VLPEKQYLPAYALAQEVFAKKDPEVMARAAAVDYDPERQVFFVPYLGVTYSIKYPEGTSAGEKEIHLARCTLLLHYLAGATGRPVAGKWVSFREIPGGNDYFPVFNRDAVQPLLDFFGQRPETLAQAAQKVGAQVQPSRGHLSFLFHPLPRVPLVLNFWEADDEFPASANFLFDAGVIENLPIYDLKVLAIEQGRQLIKVASSGGLW